MEIKVHPEIRSFKCSDLNPAEYNPRKIDEEALTGLAKSVAKFGLVELIIVNVRDGRNVIVGGHQRFKVVQQSGVETIDCIVVDLSVEDEKLLNLSLNNPHIQGQFIDAVSDYIAALKAQIPDEQDILDLRLDELMDEIKATEGLTDDDAVPEPPKEAITQPGDLWLLGAYWECDTCGKRYDYAEGKAMVDAGKECACGTA
jgi:hypothetical protein